MTVEKTPKIIHFLWLDKEFRGKGKMTDNLKFFKDRIYDLHSNYEINFVNDRKTVDKDIEKAGEEYSWIKNVIDSEFVSPAHKSDVMRFFYLYTVGGVWLDITTFLLESVDDLINKNNLGFSCYYMPQKLAQSKMMGWEFLHNLIPYPNFVNITNGNITNSDGNEEPLFSSINPEYEQFDFIPENYFIISRKEHPICGSILEMFEKHYKDVGQISNIVDVNDYHNIYMYDLFNQVFNPDEGILKELNYQIKSLGEGHKKEVLRKIFSLTGGGSYLFNYLMMFIAIASHSNEDNLKKLTVISEERESVLTNGDNGDNEDKSKFIESVKKYKKYVCDEDSCRDILLGRQERDGEVIDINKLELEENEVYLMSAQYIRLTKWSNSLVDRLKTWDNTPIKPLLTMTKQELSSGKKKNEKYENLMKTLKNLDITQIKFSSFTRESPMVENLRKITEGHYKFANLGQGTINSSATEEVKEEGDEKDYYPASILETDNEGEVVLTPVNPPNYITHLPSKSPSKLPPLPPLGEAAAAPLPVDDDNWLNKSQGGGRHLRKRSNNSRKLKRKHKNKKFMTKVKNKKSKNKKTKNKKTNNKKTKNKKTKNKKTKSKSR